MSKEIKITKGMRENAEEVVELTQLNSVPRSTVQKAQVLLESANAVLTEICEGSDSIKIDAWAEIKELLEENVSITKPFFFELVNIRRKKLFGDLEIDKDLLEKMDADALTSAKKSATRKHLYTDMQTNDDKINRLLSLDTNVTVTEGEPEYFPMDKRITSLLDECATTRQRLNATLWPLMKKHHDAYVVECNGDPKEFWQMLQYFHYRTGGYPNEKTPPKLWSVVDKYKTALDLCAKFEYDLCEQWNKRFGLQVVSTEKQSNWQDYNI
ncbi:MAG: hypothetical protein WC979_00060 [Candidatus Pacearchaeota archaeon]|jgi:hypothetical protein|nr:hypothetical protein [Clostridia bacterium]